MGNEERWQKQDFENFINFKIKLCSTETLTQTHTSQSIKIIFIGFFTSFQVALSLAVFNVVVSLLLDDI